MALMKQSTAYTRTFLMVDSADHVTGKTGVTPAVKLSKAGGSAAAAGGTVTEVDSVNFPGLYKIVYTTTDTNTLGDLAAHCTAAGADPTDLTTDQVVAFDPTDAAALGLSRIDTNIASRMATFTLPTNFSALSIDANGRVKALVGFTKGVSAVVPFEMFDSTNHAPKTGASFTARLVKQDSGAYATTTNTVTEIANGSYIITLTAAEMTGNAIVLRLKATGCDDSVLVILPSQ